MKNAFPGYYSPSAAEFETIWREGIFVPDANVLLDVYRFSEETVTQLFATFERVGPRLWLPHQAALEYHRNLTSVIAQQQKPYSDALKSLKQLRDVLANPREHPFVQRDLLDDSLSLLDRLETALTDRQAGVLDVLTENPNKERLATLFEGKLGEACAAERLTAIYAEGVTRYSAKIPPGYEDAKEKPEPERYGDLVMWMQILEKARESRQPVVLITRDVKEDWFVRAAGRTIGPRPELISEMRVFADVQFHIYTTTAFLQFANEYLGAAIPESAIQEVRQNEARLNLRDGPQFRVSAAEHVSGALSLDISMLRHSGLLPRQPYYVAVLTDDRVAIVHRKRPDAYAVFRPTREGGYELSSQGTSEWSERIVNKFDPDMGSGLFVEFAVDDMLMHSNRARSISQPFPTGLTTVEPGDKVLHPAFGVGVVQGVAGLGDSLRATVDFSDTGRKTLLLKYAGLERVEDEGEVSPEDQVN